MDGGNSGNQGQSMVAIQLTPKNGSFKMDSGWYSGNVEVRIICIATEPQNIKYTVTRGGEIEVDEDPVGEEGPITFDVTNEGITTVTAWTVDDSGNTTPKKTLNVRIDKNNPDKPDLYVLKDGVVDISNESEKWLGIDGKITAAGADENSKIGLKINKIEYEISKTGEMTRTDSQNGQIVDIASKELGDDGTYLVKAWTVDQAGRKSSEYSEVTVKKDTIAPTNVKFVSTNAMSQRITVSVTGKDTNGSGIFEYIFKYKESSAGGYTEAGTITVNNAETCQYSYTNLKIGGTYDLAVEVRDKAGNKTTATTDGYVSTKEWIAKAGDYVSYTPRSSGSSYSVAAAYSGVASAQSFSTQDFNWRIWDIDEDSDKLILIADGVTSNLTLSGAQGYNNAVKIMNDMCQNRYSAGKAVGRAFNFDDIEAKLKTKPSASFTSRTNYTSASYRYYPIIHMYERYSNVDGNDIEANGGEFAKGQKALGLSEQKVYYSATESGATSGRIQASSSIYPYRNLCKHNVSNSFIIQRRQRTEICEHGNKISRFHN